MQYKIQNSFSKIYNKRVLKINQGHCNKKSVDSAAAILSLFEEPLGALWAKIGITRSTRFRWVIPVDGLMTDLTLDIFCGCFTDMNKIYACHFTKGTSSCSWRHTVISFFINIIINFKLNRNLYKMYDEQILCNYINKK